MLCSPPPPPPSARLRITGVNIRAKCLERRYFQFLFLFFYSIKKKSSCVRRVVTFVATHAVVFLGGTKGGRFCLGSGLRGSLRHVAVEEEGLQYLIFEHGNL